MRSDAGPAWIARNGQKARPSGRDLATGWPCWFRAFARRARRLRIRPGVVTPARAVEAGAPYITLGRAVTGAADPAAAMDRINGEIEQAGA